ncbi:hypothetical protein C8R46DRAFT_1235974 [Mycena filopes]|nr:hypothetical protein C8R46DRAFT_1235974 [Mycena filopes]
MAQKQFIEPGSPRECRSVQVLFDELWFDMHHHTVHNVLDNSFVGSGVTLKLRTDRGLIQSQLDSLVYPIQSLPLDVTLEIFGHCSLVREHHHGYWSPTTVFRVCKSWREIALATPSLWKTINFRLRHGRSGYAIERYLDYRATVAQDCPLSVSIRGEDIVENLGEQGFVALLCRLAPRLYSLKLNVAVSGLFALDRDPPSFPLLEKLDIYLSDENLRSTPIENAFTIAPLLREVRTRAGPMDFRWTQITKFDSQYVSVEECCYILEEAENLLEAKFRLDKYTASSDGRRPVRHSHLQTLIVRSAFRSTQKTSLLSLLTFPALRSLHLLDTPDGDVEQIRSFLTRHAAQLRTFSFSGCTTRAITIDAVRPMLDLTNLRLDIWTGPVSYVNDLIRELGNSEHALFLPQLRSISLLRCFFPLESADVGMVARGLSSRWEARNNQLTSFYLEWVPPSSDFKPTALEVEIGVVADTVDGAHYNETRLSPRLAQPEWPPKGVSLLLSVPLAGQRVFTFPGSAQSGDELWPIPRHCVTLFNASWRTSTALMRTVGFLGVGSQPSCTLVVGPQA